MSTWRCQLEDFRGTPLEFCFGGPFLSARCGTNVLCPKIRDFPRKCSTLRLLEKRPRDGKSPKIIDFPRETEILSWEMSHLWERGGEVSLGNVARWDAGKGERFCPGKCRAFEKLWGGGGTLCPDGICQLNNSVFRNFLAVRSQLENSFELIFEICHLTFNLKMFWN